MDETMAMVASGLWIWLGGPGNLDGTDGSPHRTQPGLHPRLNLTPVLADQRQAELMGWFGQVDSSSESTGIDLYAVWTNRPFASIAWQSDQLAGLPVGPGPAGSSLLAV